MISTNAPPLRLQRASLSHGRRAVLREMSFAVGPGEFIGMFGPNGAGKTTLLRAILGLVPLAGGEMRVLGQPPARGNPAIGYMPQSRASLADIRLCGRELVAGAVHGHRLGLARLGVDGRRDVDRVLGIVDAHALAARPVGELSGGERQRLLLAQALLGRPRLLLLDEPLMSLDPRHQHGAVGLVRAVQRELGIAVLFSAHDINPLLGQMDRVLCLGGGQAAIGAVDEVVTGPVLSRLYRAPIEVVRLQGRIFVVGGAAGGEATAGA